MAIVTALLMVFMALSLGVIWQDWVDSEEGITYGGKVPLEAHIMSKCPDARDCLRDMILPAMQNISDKVDFKLSYIGRYVCQHLWCPATR
jgi:hypothetical protein